MTVSQHLNLPLILPAQAGKHVTHNEAVAALDTLTQLAVLDRDLGTPPAGPSNGDRYIVGAAATGDWSGAEGKIAAWDGAAWLFHAPEPGWLAYLIDENGLVVWTGSGWQTSIGLDGEVPMLGINATPDGTNRLAAASDAILFTHVSGDVQLKVNKGSSGDTASLLYQTGFSGRAEIGTAGDDKLHVKVSADGAAWTEALVIDPATGNLGAGTATPAVRLDVAGPIRVAAYTVGALPPATAAGQLIFVSNEVGGAVPAFSDGSAWRRVTDRAVVG